jgi:hypothetical protein
LYSEISLENEEGEMRFWLRKMRDLIPHPTKSTGQEMAGTKSITLGCIIILFVLSCLFSRCPATPEDDRPEDIGGAWGR